MERGSIDMEDTSFSDFFFLSQRITSEKAGAHKKGPERIERSEGEVL